MKRQIAWLHAIAITSVLSLGAVSRLSAQTVAAAPAKADTADDTLVLSPFVVSTTEDQGYAAKDTLAGTRVRTDLKDVASAISVVTKQFLQDTGATNNESLLQYTPNTEVGGVRGNFSGVAGGTSFHEEGNLLRPNGNTRVRGLDAADNTRDYFLTEIPWDGFNVDRVDLQRGPNSILFGVGSPAGIINTSVNTAGFKNSNKIENRVDRYGSLRFSGDFNYVLIPHELAIRVALLNDDTKYQQKPAFNNDSRYFAALRWEPKFFGEGSHTQFRANYENGKVNANRPRSLPPIDAITPWFLTGNDAQGNANLNKRTFNQYSDNKSALVASIPWLNNGAVGRIFWNDVVAYYGNQNDSAPTSYMQPAGTTNYGIGPNGLIDKGIGGLLGSLPFAVTSYSSYSIAANIPGGANYADKTLTDPTVFDFFNKLIDGNNSYQWQKWQSANFAVSQTFFNDKLGFELVYDWQRYKDGQRAFLGSSDTYKLGVDINNTLGDGTPNPNVGRPFVASSDEQANNQTIINRDSVRFTVTGEIRAEDFLGKSTLASILGKQVFTGLLGEDKKRTANQNWATSAATVAYADLFGGFESLTGHFRSYDYIAYLGNSLSGASSAAGARVGSVGTIIKAPRSANVRYFDNRWAKSTVPTAANYVDPSAPYTYIAQNGTTQLSTQSENPANYGGWKSTPVTFLNADNGDRAALTYNTGKQRNIIDSQSGTWQGYFFDGDFVPVFGWRKDTITNASGSGAIDALGIASQDFGYQPARKVTGESRSWGGVLHLPKKLAEKLPGGTDISIFYNRSQNFKADAPRGDVFGNVIPNPLGKTKEYGVVVSTLHDKLSLKVNWYETTVANATLSGGSLGQNGYYLWAVPVWGTAFVVNAYEGILGNNDNNAWAWNYASNDDNAAPNFRLPDNSLNPAWQNHPSTIKEKAAIADWKNLPLPQSFFNAYGNEVALINVAKLKAGDYPGADPIWATKFDNQPISGGQLAGFGSGPVMSVDTVSKGTEYELVAQPTKNWNISVNASKTFATRIALAPTIASYITDMTKFLAGPAGDIRIWGGGASNAFRIQWNNNIVIPYQVLLAQQGSNAPEIAPWRYNLVSTYNIDHGAMKGGYFGGAFRFEQARVLGYQYSATLGAIDVKKPLYGPDDKHVDLWFGYSRKLTTKINWRIQANLRSVGEKTKLVPVSINPDGATAFSRIQAGMGWQLTNTFEF